MRQPKDGTVLAPDAVVARPYDGNAGLAAAGVVAQTAVERDATGKNDRDAGKGYLTGDTCGSTESADRNVAGRGNGTARDRGAIVEIGLDAGQGEIGSVGDDRVETAPAAEEKHVRTDGHGTGGTGKSRSNLAGIDSGGLESADGAGNDRLIGHFGIPLVITCK